MSRRYCCFRSLLFSSHYLVLDRWILAKLCFERPISSYLHQNMLGWFVCSSSQSEHRICFILPACGFNHKILIYMHVVSVRLRWLDIHVLIDLAFVFENKNTKKNKANIQPSWPKKFGHNDLLHGQKENFNLRDKHGNPDWARWAHLAGLCSQVKAGFASSCPLEISVKI